jgi:hypothetical protein
MGRFKGRKIMENLKILNIIRQEAGDDKDPGRVNSLRRSLQSNPSNPIVAAQRYAEEGNVVDTALYLLVADNIPFAQRGRTLAKALEVQATKNYNGGYPLQTAVKLGELPPETKSLLEKAKNLKGLAEKLDPTASKII